MTETLAAYRESRLQSPNAKSEATVLGELFAQHGVILSRKEQVEYLAKLAVARNQAGATVMHCAEQDFPEVADEERFLVGEFWGHCFVPGVESEVRFVIDRRCGQMVYCEVGESTFTWKQASCIQYANLLGSLYDNDVIADPTLWAELGVTGTMPYWAAMPLTLRMDRV